MIVKNEGKTIYKALLSVKDIVDEFIIGVDESTEDNTAIEIARFCNTYTSASTDVYYYKWKNDFSKARNHAISKCKHEYVFILDGHEYLEQDGIKKLKKIKKDNPKFDVFLIELRMDNKGTCVEQPRLFKKKYKYHNAIHNTIVFDSKKAAKITGVQIVHDRPNELGEQRLKQRKEYGIDELWRKMKAGDKTAARQLGHEYFAMKEFDKAVLMYEKYMEHNMLDRERYQILIQLALSNFQLKQYDVCESDLKLAFQFNEDQRNAHLVLLSSLYSQQKQYYRALYYACWAAQIKRPQQFFYIYPEFYNGKPGKMMESIYKKIG